MQIILTQDHHPIGQKGQSVNVKPGYFRNFLLPKGIAVMATKKLLVKAEEINRKLEEEKAAARKEATKIRDLLAETVLHLKEKLTKKGTLYSKVSAKEVQEALKSQAKVDLSVENIHLPQAIKAVGNYEIDLKLGGGLMAKVKLSIEGIED